MTDTNEDLKTIRVASVEQLLGAGYVPEGRNLRGKDGSVIDAAFLASYSGKIALARTTESKAFPVTVDGNILPAAAVAFETKRETLRGQQHVSFSDGSLSIGGTHYSVKESAKLIRLVRASHDEVEDLLIRNQK